MTSTLLAGSTILLLQAVLFGLEVTHAIAARPHLSGNREGPEDPPPKYYGNHAYGERCGCSYSVPNLKVNDCCADGLLCDPSTRTCRVAVGESCKEKTVSLSNRKCAREAYGPQKDIIHCGTQSCCIQSIPAEAIANPSEHVEIFKLHKPVNGAIRSCCGGIIKIQDIGDEHYPFCAEHVD